MFEEFFFHFYVFPLFLCFIIYKGKKRKYIYHCEYCIHEYNSLQFIYFLVHWSPSFCQWPLSLCCPPTLSPAGKISGLGNSLICSSLICSSLIRSFAQIAQDKWKNVSDLLRSLRTNERVAHFVEQIAHWLVFSLWNSMSQFPTLTNTNLQK